ncbi:hypothetical protein [Pedobacter sp. MC2016-24]|uniref:hypothetical protein n=1 Tax=Pedobacter sp. MC2016-24 TaxID=2780090 RepID=UPI0018820056|nr:hypothetical protein [Pedobacter sp. MC2016-24]MBE9603149.1 hypothetical protein [Pedobacter sp. MC2016-24]
MIRKFMVVSCALAITLIACHNSDTKYLSGKDSADILRTVLDNKDFKRELETKDDTVYILKTEKYNKSWPSATEAFNIEYLEDSKDNRMVNKGPGMPYDKRVRLSIPSFDKKTDTVFVSVFDEGYEMSFYFKLIRKHNIWQVVDQRHGMN